MSGTNWDVPPTYGLDDRPSSYKTDYDPLDAPESDITPDMTIVRIYPMVMAERPDDIDQAATGWTEFATQLQAARTELHNNYDKVAQSWNSLSGTTFTNYVAGTTTSIYDWQSTAAKNGTALSALAGTIRTLQTAMTTMWAEFESDAAAAEKPHSMTFDHMLALLKKYGNTATVLDPVLEKYTNRVRNEIVGPMNQAFSDAFSAVGTGYRFQGPKNGPSEAAVKNALTTIARSKLPTGRSVGSVTGPPPAVPAPPPAPAPPPPARLVRPPTASVPPVDPPAVPPPPPATTPPPEQPTAPKPPNAWQQPVLPREPTAPIAPAIPAPPAIPVAPVVPVAPVSPVDVLPSARPTLSAPALTAGPRVAMPEPPTMPAQPNRPAQPTNPRRLPRDLLGRGSGEPEMPPGLRTPPPTLSGRGGGTGRPPLRPGRPSGSEPEMPPARSGPALPGRTKRTRERTAVPADSGDDDIPPIRLGSQRGLLGIRDTTPRWRIGAGSPDEPRPLRPALSGRRAPMEEPDDTVGALRPGLAGRGMGRPARAATESEPKRRVPEFVGDADLFAVDQSVSPVIEPPEEAKPVAAGKPALRPAG